ncbi:hypothetical protein D9M68_638960 [compost metagenome]
MSPAFASVASKYTSTLAPSARSLIGVLGATVSTTKFQVLLAPLVWPLGLVDVAVMPCVPSVRPTGGVKLQLPEASATAWPRYVEPS